MTRHHLTRRAFGGAALLGAAAPALAGCGSDEATTGASSPAGEFAVPTADVPVGGGVVLEDAKVVVVQPAEGDFKCFTAVCTHQGCLVGSVADNRISCPCHQSAFSSEDGTVINGPATEPLDEVPVTVAGGEVARA